MFQCHVKFLVIVIVNYEHNLHACVKLLVCKTTLECCSNSESWEFNINLFIDKILDEHIVINLDVTMDMDGI